MLVRVGSWIVFGVGKKQIRELHETARNRSEVLRYVVEVQDAGKPADATGYR